ncbi:MAG TPA: hypothetical protein VF331_06850 [Polyangiales bacterium]
MTSRRNPAASRSRSQLLALAACAGLCGFHAQVRAQAPAASARIDGLAVLIGGSGPGEGVEVILRSDVELRARLSLLRDDAERALTAALPSGLLSATLSELIGEALIAREAERVQIATATAADVQREKQRLIVGAGGAAQLGALLTKLGASEAEIDTLARRRAVAAAFLSANLEGAMLVTDGEVEQRYQADPASFAGLDPQKARDLIRASLRSEALNRNIERWVRVLSARTPLRVFAHFDEP